MSAIENSNCKICELCDEQVHDLRTKSKSEIKDWFQSQESPKCVFIEANQLSNSKESTYLGWRKLGIASILFGGLFFNPLYGQESTKADSYVIEQSDIESQSIIIQGKVKVKKFLGWHSLKDFSINIFSDDSLISEVLIDERGRFVIELSRADLSKKMTISIHALNYKSIRIKDIPVKNTDIKVFLDERDYRFVTGRFF